MPDRIKLKAGAFALKKKRELRRAGRIIKKHRLFLIPTCVFMLAGIAVYAAAVHARNSSFRVPETLGESVVLYEVRAGRSLSDAPLDLNTATREDLLSVEGIDEDTADMIILYREAMNGFLAVFELKNIDGISDERYEQIKRYFTV